MQTDDGLLIISVGASGWLRTARALEFRPPGNPVPVSIGECAAASKRPDLDHGGTQGEMLTLVRKAYPGCCVEVTVWEDGSATVYIRDGGTGDLLHDAAGDSLGLALAAALLAAPGKAGEL